MARTRQRASKITTPADERRQLTILFCDLVASTELAGRLDPEDYSVVIRDYEKCAAREIERLGGYVADYIGDGLLAYFGYPLALEHAAERAVRAGLAILDAMRTFNESREERRICLAVRIAIHTGVVVVGDSGGSSTTVFGQTPNVTARVQLEAEPNTVYITEGTHRLVAGLFIVEDCGRRVLRGVREPMRLYRVVRQSGVRGRLDAAAGGLSTFVDRESECRLLFERWEHACHGEGQVMLITGEAGIGKSRLVRKLQEHLAGEPHTWITCYGSVHHAHTPFHAVVDMLQEGFGWAHIASTERRLETVERSLQFAGLRPAEALPLVARLLGLPVPERQGELLASAEMQRKALLATLASWLVALAGVQPVVTLVEDLQWVDPSTLELLGLLAAQGANAPLLLLYTARPEFRAPWPLLAHHTTMTLSRLSAAHIRDMITHLVPRAGRSDPMIETIVARADGIPLFAEELAKAVVETRGQGVEASIPTTLADSLMARLDQLASAKEVAQIGAVLGREFPHDVLRAVCELPDGELDRALARLAETDVLYAHGVLPDVTYVFKHALVRDAAYESLVRPARQALHRRVAAALEERLATATQDESAVLAHHLERAEDFEKAVRYWKRAGDRSMAHAAYAESITLFERGVALLERLPPSQSRSRSELALMESLGTALLLTRGYSAPEVDRTFMRARDLCHELGIDVPVRALYGAYAFHVVRSDREASTALLSQLHRLAERSGEPVAQITAHASTGLHAFLSGDFVVARDEMTAATKWYDTDGYRAFFREYGYDGGLYPFAMLMWALWILGYPERSLAVRDQIFALAELNASPHSRLIAFTFAAVLAHDRREPEVARDMAEQVLRIAAEQHLLHWAGPATCIHGWVAVQGGEMDRGRAEIQRGLAILDAVGFRTWRGYYLSYLAESDLARGAAVGGLEAVHEALAMAQTLLDRFYEAELHRLEGELRRRQGELSTAEASFRHALEIASRQHARAFELRAAVSCSRLLSDRGDRKGARALLEPVYRSFTEGFRTRDLQEASALLTELEPA